MREALHKRMVLRYDFENTDGTQVFDESKSLANTATMHADPSTAIVNNAPISAHAMRFDGIDDHLELYGSSDLDLSNLQHATFTCFIRTEEDSVGSKEYIPILYKDQSYKLGIDFSQSDAGASRKGIAKLEMYNHVRGDFENLPSINPKEGLPALMAQHIRISDQANYHAPVAEFKFEDNTYSMTTTNTTILPSSTGIVFDESTDVVNLGGSVLSNTDEEMTLSMWVKVKQEDMHKNMALMSMDDAFTMGLNNGVPYFMTPPEFFPGYTKEVATDTNGININSEVSLSSTTDSNLSPLTMYNIASYTPLATKKDLYNKIELELEKNPDLGVVFTEPNATVSTVATVSNVDFNGVTVPVTAVPSAYVYTLATDGTLADVKLGNALVQVKGMTDPAVTFYDAASDGSFTKVAIDDYSISESNVLTINSGYAVSTSPFDNVWVFAVTGNGIPQEPTPKYQWWRMEIEGLTGTATYYRGHELGIFNTDYTESSGGYTLENTERFKVYFTGGVVHSGPTQYVKEPLINSSGTYLQESSSFKIFNLFNSEVNVAGSFDDRGLPVTMDNTINGVMYFDFQFENPIRAKHVVFTDADDATSSANNGGIKVLNVYHADNHSNTISDWTLYASYTNEGTTYYSGETHTKVLTYNDTTTFDLGAVVTNFASYNNNYDTSPTTSEYPIIQYTPEQSGWTSSQLQTMATLYTQIPDQGLAHYTYSSTTDSNLTAKSFEGLTMTHAFSNINSASITPITADTQYTVVAVGEQDGEYVAGFANLVLGPPDTDALVNTPTVLLYDLYSGDTPTMLFDNIKSSATLGTDSLLFNNGLHSANNNIGSKGYVYLKLDTVVRLSKLRIWQVTGDSSGRAVGSVWVTMTETERTSADVTTMFSSATRLMDSISSPNTGYTTTTEDGVDVVEINVDSTANLTGSYMYIRFGSQDATKGLTEIAELEIYSYVDGPTTATTQSLTWTPSASNNDISKTAIDDYSITESNVLTINSGYAVSTSPFENVWVFAVTGNGGGGPPVLSDPALMELVSDLNVGTVADQYTNGIYGTYTRRIVLHNGDVVHTTKDKDLAAAQTTGTSGSVHGGNAFIPYNDASPSGTYFYVAVADSGIGYIALLYTFNSGPKTLAGVKIQNGANHNPSATSYVFAATEIEFYYLPQDNSEITSASDRTNLVQITKSPAGQTGGDAVYTEYNFDSIVTTKQIEIRIYNSSGSTYTNHKQIGSIDFFEIATSSVSPAFTSSQLQTMATLFTQIPDQGLAHYTYSSTTDSNLTAKSFEGLTMTHAFSNINSASITPITADTQYTVVAVGEQGGEYVAGYANKVSGSVPVADLELDIANYSGDGTIANIGDSRVNSSFAVTGTASVDSDELSYIRLNRLDISASIILTNELSILTSAPPAFTLFYSFRFINSYSSGEPFLLMLYGSSSHLWIKRISETTAKLIINYNTYNVLTPPINTGDLFKVVISYNHGTGTNTIRWYNDTTDTMTTYDVVASTSYTYDHFIINGITGRGGEGIDLYTFKLYAQHLDDLTTEYESFINGTPLAAPTSLTTSSLTWTPSASNNDISKTAIDDYSITESNVLTINSGYAVSTSPFDNVWVFVVVAAGTPKSITYTPLSTTPRSSPTSVNLTATAIDDYGITLGGYNSWASFHPDITLTPTIGNYYDFEAYVERNVTTDPTDMVIALYTETSYNYASSTFSSATGGDVNVGWFFKFSSSSPEVQMGYKNPTPPYHTSLNIAWDDFPIYHRIKFVDKSEVTATASLSVAYSVIYELYSDPERTQLEFELPIDSQYVVNGYDFAPTTFDPIPLTIFTYGIANNNIHFKNFYGKDDVTPASEVSFTTSQLQTMATLFTQIPDQGLAHYTYSSTTDPNLTAKSFEGLTMTHAFSSIDGASITPITADTQYTVVAVGEQDGEYVAGYANVTVAAKPTIPGIEFQYKANNLGTAYVWTDLIHMYDIVLYDSSGSVIAYTIERSADNVNFIKDPGNNVLTDVETASRFQDESSNYSIFVVSFNAQTVTEYHTLMTIYPDDIPASIKFKTNDGWTKYGHSLAFTIESVVQAEIEYGDSGPGTVNVDISYAPPPAAPTITTSSLTWTPSASNNDISKTAIDDYSISESNVLTINSGYAVSTSPFDNVWVFAVVPPVVEAPEEKLYYRFFINTMKSGSSAHYEKVEVISQTTSTRRFYVNGNSHTYNNDIVQSSSRQSFSYVNNSSIWGFVLGTAPSQGEWFILDLTDFKDETVVIEVTESFNNHGAATYEIQKWTGEGVPELWDTSFANSNKSYINDPLVSNSVAPGSSGTIQVIVPEPVTGWEKVAEQNTSITVTGYGGGSVKRDTSTTFTVSTNATTPETISFTSTQLQTMATLFTQIPDQGLAHYTYSSTTDSNLTVKSFEGLTMTHAFSNINSASITPITADTQYTVVAVGEQKIGDDTEYVAGFANISRIIDPQTIPSTTVVLEGSTIEEGRGAALDGTRYTNFTTNGVALDTTTFKTGTQSLYLNSTSSYIALGPQAYMGSHMSWSTSFWYKPTNELINQEMIYFQFGSHNYRFIFKCNAAKTIDMFAIVNGVTYGKAGGTGKSFSDYLVWHHLSMVHEVSGSTTTVRWYINGTMETEASFDNSSITPLIYDNVDTYTVESSSTNYQVTFGNRTGDTRWGQPSYFDEIKLYDYALTSEEVVLSQNIYSNVVESNTTTQTLTWTPSASNNDISKTAIDDYSITESNVLTINSGYAVSTSPFDNVWVFAVVAELEPITKISPTLSASDTTYINFSALESHPYKQPWHVFDGVIDATNNAWNAQANNNQNFKIGFDLDAMGNRGVTRIKVWRNEYYYNAVEQMWFQNFMIAYSDTNVTSVAEFDSLSWDYYVGSESKYNTTANQSFTLTATNQVYSWKKVDASTGSETEVNDFPDLTTSGNSSDTNISTFDHYIIDNINNNNERRYMYLIFTQSLSNSYVQVPELEIYTGDTSSTPSFTTTEIQTMVTTHIENGTTEGTDYHKYTNVSRQLFNGETLTNAFSSIEGSTTEAIDSASDYIVVAVGEQGGDYVVGMANLTMGSPYLDFRSNVYFLENANRLSTNTTITENSIEVVSPNWKRTTIHNALIDTSLVGKTYEFEFGLIDNITNLTDDYFAIDLVRSDATIAESLGSSGHWNDTAVTDATRNLQQLSITNDTYGLVLGGWGSRVGQTTTSHRTILPGERPYYWRLTVVASDTGGFNDVKWEMFVDPDRTPESLQYSNLFSKSDYSTANLNNFFTNNSEFYISFIGVYNSVYFRNFGTLSASTLTTNSLTWTQ
jgi:hypothetical protein